MARRSAYLGSHGPNPVGSPTPRSRCCTHSRARQRSPSTTPASSREIEERNTDLSESLELQTATSEALRLISTHPGDLTTVLDAIVTKAASLCDAPFGSVLLKDGPVLRISAANIDVGSDMAIGMEFPADDGNVNTHAATSKTALAFDDLHVIAPELAETFPSSRSYATVALFSEAEWIGNINIVRPEVRPFDDAELAILQAFADQASLAVSNARLFNDLDAALERQTAMTDVLEAVGTARLDVQPVFDRIVDHAQRLSDDTFAFISVRDETDLRTMAVAGPTSPDSAARDYLGDLSAPQTIDNDTSTTGTVYLTGQPIHIPDWDEVPADHYPNSRARDSGAKSLLALPMRRRAETVGVMTFTRLAAGGYSDSEISLLQAFADQAAIAVDNARLLREIEERNADLSESLELQTSTASVLRLISANPGDLNTVLDGVVERAMALCDATAGSVTVRRGDAMRVEAATNWGDVSGFEFPAASALVPEDTATERTPAFIADYQVTDTYGPVQEIGRRAGIRSVISVPMLGENGWIGNINLARHEVRPFDDHDAEVLITFADQAAIAVANARLFNDLDAALERQTAMTEVLDAVSTARLDLQPVFDTVARHADRLCNGAGAMVLVREGDGLVLSAVAGPSPAANDRCGNPSGRCRRVLDHRRSGPQRRDHPHPGLGRRVRSDLCRFAGETAGPPERIGNPDDARRRRHRCHRLHPRGAGWISRRRDRTAGNVRRPGRHRRRQRPPAARDRGTQHRTLRVAGTADRHVAHPAADQRPPGRPRRRVPWHRVRGRSALRR